MHYYEFSRIGHGHWGLFPCTVSADKMRATYAPAGEAPVATYANYYINGKCPKDAIQARAAETLMPLDSSYHNEHRRLVLGFRKPIVPSEE